METIRDQYFEGERPLYARKGGLYLENVTIGTGESSIKEGADIEAVRCEFRGKYPFWECDNFTIRDCIFREGARSALWYSRGCRMYDTLVEAPKMFRRISGVYLENVRMPNALETFWDCENVVLNKVEILKADYLFMHADGVRIRDYRQEGNYSFQYARNVEIHNADIESKDSFWESEDCTIYDSRINGEYLGWYSRNLRLVNCIIGGTQPLCYCENLILENCRFEPDADLAFEYSSVKADVRGHIVSVKNPSTGIIEADSIGEIIIDSNVKEPADAQIFTREQQ
ncbi:MAG: DUF3737 family protein [Bacteroidales bacterium]|nr:DUF3737 family protein [Bacteroidales bacterium]